MSKKNKPKTEKPSPEVINQVLPELLAPAGNLDTALAAFSSGADAVYAGLAKFNARERTENFSLEKMDQLLAYARKQHKKVYVTLNTLIKESELEEVAQVLDQLVKLRPDAVIIQDLGLLQMIREFYPLLPVHASTQMGFHNSAGLNVAHKLGIKRVILERQITLPELRKIVKAPPLELEIFVHGALCCSLSGQCLFSSWHGGWSGNRGKCKQPCRRRFFANSGNGFFFSTNDLYTLDLIPEFKTMGISSLKIEGRLKSPDYVKAVTSAYRLILDTPYGEEMKNLKKAREILSQTCGRKWSHGFLDGNKSDSIIDHDHLGVSGQLCGKVVNADHNGFHAEFFRPVHIGDRLRIQPQSGDEGPAFALTQMSVKGQSVAHARKGTRCFIPCDREIPPHGLIYKIAKRETATPKQAASLPKQRPFLDLDIQISSNRIMASVVNSTPEHTWEEATSFAPAQNQPLTPQTVRDQFSGTGNEDFQCGDVQVRIEGELFVPASILKQLRKEFWQWCNTTVTETDLAESDGSHAFKQAYHAMESVSLKNKEETILTNRKMGRKPHHRYICHWIYDLHGKPDQVMLPEFCSEFQIKDLKQQIDALCKKGFRHFRVTSLYAFDLLPDRDDLSIHLSFPLPVTNSMAARFFQKTFKPVASLQAWVELSRKDLSELSAKSPIQTELYRCGRLPILATRAKLQIYGRFRDARGNGFETKFDKHTGLSYLLSDQDLSLPEMDNMTNFIDLRFSNRRNDNTTHFNFDRDMI